MPNIFQGRQLRSGVKYRCLRDYFFLNSECKWLCEEINRYHDVRIKQVVSPVAISRRYGLDIDGIRYWLALFKKGDLDLDHVQCRSPILDQISVRKIAKDIVRVGSGQIDHKRLQGMLTVEEERTKERRERKRLRLNISKHSK